MVSTLAFLKEPFCAPGAVLGMSYDIQKEGAGACRLNLWRTDVVTVRRTYDPFQSLVACDRQSSIGHPIRLADWMSAQTLFIFFIFVCR